MWRARNKKKINDEQHTLDWHADDAKSSHGNPKINDDFDVWCEENHGIDDLGHVASTRGKRHDCAGMTIDYSESKAVLIDMTEHMDQLKADFLDKLEKNNKVWGSKFFSARKKSKRLCNEKSDTFHSFAMKKKFTQERPTRR